MYIMTSSYSTTFDLSRILRENATDLIIPNGYFNGITSLILSDNADLRRIEIGENTFTRVRSFELISLIRTLY